MKITLYCIGSLKESYWRSAAEEYLKRLQAYAKVTVEEFPDLATKEGLSPKEEAEIKEKEGTRVLQKIKSGDYVIAMDLNQKEFDSISFSSYLENAFVKGRSSLIFLIGGSLGLSDALKARANDSISFGKMTFPHQLSLIMLLEQLYRAFRIAHHEPYHK